MTDRRQSDALVSFSFKIYKGYFHCEFLSSCCRRLLNLPETPRATQRWQSVGWRAGLASIGQAGNRKKRLYNRIHVHTYTQKHKNLIFSSMYTWNMGSRGYTPDFLPAIIVPCNTKSSAPRLNKSVSNVCSQKDAAWFTSVFVTNCSQPRHFWRRYKEVPNQWVQDRICKGVVHNHPPIAP